MTIQPTIVCCKCKQRVPMPPLTHGQKVHDGHCPECRQLWLAFQELEPRFYRKGYRLRLFAIEERGKGK